MVLDTFWLQDANGKAFEKPDLTERLLKRIKQTLAGDILPTQELARQTNLSRRTRVFKVAPRVLTDNGASHHFTVIEVNGRDRPGLLYDVTRGLSGLSLQIASAHVTTYGERAVDVFYVKDIFGMKIEHETKQKQIRETLIAAIEGWETRAEAAVAAAGK